MQNKQVSFGNVLQEYVCRAACSDPSAIIRDVALLFCLLHAATHGVLILKMEPNADIVQMFGPPPDGLDISESSVVQNNAAVIVLAVLASLAVVLRLMARYLQGHNLKADDWAIIASLVRVLISHLRFLSESNLTDRV